MASTVVHVLRIIHFGSSIRKSPLFLQCVLQPCHDRVCSRILCNLTDKRGTSSALDGIHLAEPSNPFPSRSVPCPHPQGLMGLIMVCSQALTRLARLGKKFGVCLAVGSNTIPCGVGAAGAAGPESAGEVRLPVIIVRYLIMIWEKLPQPAPQQNTVSRQYNLVSIRCGLKPGTKNSAVCWTRHSTE